MRYTCHSDVVNKTGGRVSDFSSYRFDFGAKTNQFLRTNQRYCRKEKLSNGSYLKKNERLGMKRLKWITNLISFGIKKKGQKNLTMEQRDFDMFEKCHEFEKNKRVTGAQ